MIIFFLNKYVSIFNDKIIPIFLSIFSNIKFRFNIV